MDYLTVPAVPAQLENPLLDEGGQARALGPLPETPPKTEVPSSGAGMREPTVKTLRTRQGSKRDHIGQKAKAPGSFPHRRRRRRKRQMSLKQLGILSWQKSRPYLIYLRQIICDLTQSFMFHFIVCSMVAVNTAALVAQTSPIVEVRGEWFFAAMDAVFLPIYVAEAVLKIIALDLQYFRDPWNKIDFFIMLMAVLDFVLSVSLEYGQGNRTDIDTLFRVLKICKGIRAIRAIRFILSLRVMKDIKEVLGMFLYSCHSIGAIFLVMVTLLCMFSIVMHDIFHEADEKHFGDVFRTVFTLFQLLTLDDWSLIYQDCRVAGAWYVIIFLILYIIFQYFLLLNLVIALLVDNFQMALLQRQLLKKQKMQKVNHPQASGDDEMSQIMEKGKLEELLGKMKPGHETSKPALGAGSAPPKIHEVATQLLAHSRAGANEKKEEEDEEAYFRRLVAEKFGNLRLGTRDWQLLYTYFRLMTAIDANQQQFESQAALSDRIVDIFFEAAKEENPIS